MEVSRIDYALAARRNLAVAVELQGREGRALARLALRYLERARRSASGCASARSKPTRGQRAPLDELM